MISPSGRPSSHNRIRIISSHPPGSRLFQAGMQVECQRPCAADLPPLLTAQLAYPSVINELGIKGVGESGAIPGAAAIANAVEDAVADLGASIREVPVTPARLFAALAR